MDNPCFMEIGYHQCPLREPSEGSFYNIFVFTNFRVLEMDQNWSCSDEARFLAFSSNNLDLSSTILFLYRLYARYSPHCWKLRAATHSILPISVFHRQLEKRNLWKQNGMLIKIFPVKNGYKVQFDCC